MEHALTENILGRQLI